MDMPNQQPTADSSYIQQHLANERTFLAWVRTALAMKGIGFLIFGIELAAGAGSSFTRTLATILSIISFCAGITVLSMGTWLFFKNKRTINNQQFQSGSWIVTATSLLVAAVMFSMLTYVLVFA
jgi:putative membrane protein